MRSDRRNPAYYGNRGLTYFRKGEFHRAIADYDRALALSPEDAITFANRALAYSKL
ncbi:MAG: tetratricopeptide repeat protein [Alphaproteobacteria bacterium]